MIKQVVSSARTKKNGSEEFPTKRGASLTAKKVHERRCSNRQAETSPPSSLRPGQRFERVVCLMPCRIEVAAIKRY